VPFLVNGRPDSHCPVSWPWRIVLRLLQENCKEVREVIAVSFFARFKIVSSALTSKMTGVWFADQKVSMPGQKVSMPGKVANI
jgi:hypothetical protein